MTWTNEPQPFGANHVPLLTGLSSVDGLTPVPLAADPATGKLLVSSSGGAAGTQYAEGATTAPGTGNLSLGRYKATPPSLTDGQLYGLQLDTSGNLKVTGSLSVGGTTDNSSFTAGTSTGTPTMGFYHSTIDAVTDGRAAAVAITANRAQHSNLRNASGTEVGTASTPLQVSIANTGANATAVKVDGSAVTQPVSGTFWQATQPVSGTVTSNIGTTNGLALDTSVNGLLLAQGSTTSGQSGTLVQTATTTSAPTYTTAKTNPLSTDTSGNLRTSVNNTVAVSGTFWQATQPISGTVTANAGTNLNTSALALESGGNLDDIDAALDASVISQEATTSGTKGITAYGAVTTSKPTYTTAKSDALSLDTNGLLRVSLADTPANTNKFLVTPDSVALPANQSVNVSQINGVTPLMGNGVTGTGSQRVTIASDNTAFAVNATLSAETTKAIGVVRTADGSGNLLTSTTNALDVNLKTSSITLPVSLTSTTVTGTVAVTESGTWNVGSSSATGSAVPANAFYEGGIAKTSLPTAASDGNLTGTMVDKFGRQVVLTNSIRDLVNPITQLTLTSTTTETSLIAAVASTFNDIVSLVVINTSATATQVDFRDSTAGTIRLSLYVPAGDTRGIALPTPLPQAAVNTAWTAKCGTSVASVIITGSYIANK